jgi:hypothetical protein
MDPPDAPANACGSLIRRALCDDADAGDVDADSEPSVGGDAAYWWYGGERGESPPAAPLRAARELGSLPHFGESPRLASSSSSWPFILA